MRRIFIIIFLFSSLSLFAQGKLTDETRLMQRSDSLRAELTDTLNTNTRNFATQQNLTDTLNANVRNFATFSDNGLKFQNTNGIRRIEVPIGSQLSLVIGALNDSSVDRRELSYYIMGGGYIAADYEGSGFYLYASGMGSREQLSMHMGYEGIKFKNNGGYQDSGYPIRFENHGSGDAFYISNNASLHQDFLITKTGNVGIGATFPDNKLVVAGAYNYYTDTSSVNDNWGVATNDFDNISLVEGFQVFIKIAVPNTGAATLTVGSLTQRDVVKIAGGSVTPLSTGDVVTGQILHLIYDGSVYQILSRLAQ